MKRSGSVADSWVLGMGSHNSIEGAVVLRSTACRACESWEERIYDGARDGPQG